MRRWAIVNKKNDEEVIDLGWFFDTTTQQNMEERACRLNFGLEDNERIAVVETDFTKGY